MRLTRLTEDVEGLADKYRKAGFQLRVLGTKNPYIQFLTPDGKPLPIGDAVEAPVAASPTVWKRMKKGRENILLAQHGSGNFMVLFFTPSGSTQGVSLHQRTAVAAKRAFFGRYSRPGATLLVVHKNRGDTDWKVRETITI